MKKHEITNYEVITIGPDFEVIVLENEHPPIPSKTDAITIERCWSEAQDKRGGSLFNGKLLNYIAFDNGKLTGKFVDYKLYIAQLAIPKLEQSLHIQPISISCICSFKGKQLLGKRSQKVTEFPGYYELVPSGGIDLSNVVKGRVDLLSQALQELEEETSFGREQVKSMVPFALVRELSSGRCEVCIKIDLDSDKTSEKNKLENGVEYSELLWMSPKELQLFAEHNEKLCVPFSLFLFQKFF